MKRKNKLFPAVLSLLLCVSMLWIMTACKNTGDALDNSTSQSTGNTTQNTEPSGTQSTEPSATQATQPSTTATIPNETMESGNGPMDPSDGIVDPGNGADGTVGDNAGAETAPRSRGMIPMPRGK